MTIGLILLSVISVFLFFAGTEKFFSRIGLSSRVAFFIVLALVIGAVIPEIRFGNILNIQLGGFLIPLAVMSVLFFRCEGKEEILKTLLSVTAVAAVCVAVRMLIPMKSTALVVTVSVVTGFVGAAVACIVTQSRIPALASVMGGVVLGDVITSLVFKFFIDGSTVSLGTAGVFDSVVIGTVLTLVMMWVLTVMKKRSQMQKQPLIGLDTEAGEDYPAPQVQPPEFHFTEEDYEEYFNDDID